MNKLSLFVQRVKYEKGNWRLFIKSSISLNWGSLNQVLGVLKFEKLVFLTKKLADDSALKARGCEVAVQLQMQLHIQSYSKYTTTNILERILLLETSVYVWCYNSILKSWFNESRFNKMPHFSEQIPAPLNYFIIVNSIRFSELHNLVNKSCLTGLFIKSRLEYITFCTFDILISLYNIIFFS